MKNKRAKAYFKYRPIDNTYRLEKIIGDVILELIIVNEKPKIYRIGYLLDEAQMNELKFKYELTVE